MKNARVIPVVAGIIGILVGIPLNTVPSIADTNSGTSGTGSTAGFLPQSFFSAYTPPAWNAAQFNQMANIYTSCSNFQVPMQQMAQGIAQLAGGPGMSSMGAMACPMVGSVSIQTPCMGSDAPIQLSGISCETIGMNPMALTQVQSRLQEAVCTAQCKKAKSQAIQGEVGCLTQQANLLAQQVGSLQEVFTNNIQRMQKDVLTINSTKEDRIAQLMDVSAKLGGDGGSERTGPGAGTPGLMALQKQTQEMLAQMPAEIQQAKSAVQKVASAKKSLTEKIQLRTMARTMDCFNNRTVAGYRCAANGPPVTAKEYLVCRFEQNSNLGANGAVERNAFVSAKAKAKAAELRELLDQITGDTSSMTKNPKTPEELSDQPLLVTSLPDIASRYGSFLSQYKVGNTTAESFVMNLLGTCNRRAEDQVYQEQNRVNSEIGQEKFQMREVEQQTTQMISGLFQKYNNQYSANMSGMIGINQNLDTVACGTAAQDVQVSCLENIRTVMQAMLSGSSPQFNMAVQVKGNNPSTYINFSCQGINGCVTAMQNVTRNVKNSITQLDNFKKQYVQRANQSVEAFTKQIASSLNMQSQMVTNRLKSLNAALASLGQGQGINIPTVKSEPFQYDQDGLIKAPENVLNIVGQYVNPPLPDVSSNNFANALSGVASAERTLDNNLSQLSQSMLMVQNLGPSCEMRRARDVVDRLSSVVAHNCHTTIYCTQDKIAEMHQALGKIMSVPGMQNSAASLYSGIETMCEQADLGQMGALSQDQKALRDAYNIPRGCSALYGQLIGASKSLDGTQSRTGQQMTPGSGRAW